MSCLICGLINTERAAQGGGLLFKVRAYARGHLEGLRIEMGQLQEEGVYSNFFFFFFFPFSRFLPTPALMNVRTERKHERRFT